MRANRKASTGQTSPEIGVMAYRDKGPQKNMITRIHKLSGPCTCEHSTRHSGTGDRGLTGYEPCHATAEVLIVGVERDETFATSKCLAHAIETICMTGNRRGPVYEHYVATGRLPAPEPMIDDAPSEPMFRVRYCPQSKPGETLAQAPSNAYSVAGPFTRAAAEQFATQLAGRLALLDCKIIEAE